MHFFLFRANLPKIGHFTALAASNSRYIGCGYLQFKNRAEIACNYGPGGNTVTVPIYKKGDACSACPAGYFCSKEFNGLCTGKYTIYILTKRTLSIN